VKKWDNKKEDISSECKQLLLIIMRFHIQVLHELFKQLYLKRQFRDWKII